MEYAQVSRRNAEHCVCGASCDAWRFAQSRRLSVIEECMPAGSSESHHYHRQSQQFFYILSGQAVLEYDGRIWLSFKQGLLISPRVRHRRVPDLKKPVRFLVISHSPSHGDRINDP